MLLNAKFSQMYLFFFKPAPFNDEETQF